MTDHQITFVDKQRLLDSLLEIRALHDSDLRNLYVTELEGHLGRQLSMARFPDARHDLMSIINACVSCTGGLHSFVGIIRGFQGDSVTVGGVERLVSELGRDALLAPGDRAELSHLLGGIGAAHLAAAYEEFRADGGATVDFTDLPALVRRLESLAPAESGPAPLLTFVDRLAHAVEGRHSLHLHRWNSLVGRGLALGEREQRAMCVESKRRWEEAAGAAPRNDQANSPPNLPGSADQESRSVSTDDELSISGDHVVRPSMSTLATLATHEETPLIRGGLPTRNPDFTGREDLLRNLRQSLITKSKASVLPQTLHGLGGVGKTQLALEYVYQHADDYQLVWWISAEHLSLALASLEELGRRLELPVGEDRQQTARTVRDWLSGNEISWLLVFDNADDPDEIAPLVPPTGGHVIITSRNQSWANVWASIEVDVFDRGESVALIRKRGRDIAETDANRLAEKLGDLPLALDQAASWQATTGMPVAEYLDLFDKHVHELMDEGKPPTYRTTVAAFVSLAFERLHSAAPALAQLLEMFAYLGSEPVSASLLRRARAADMSSPLDRALRESIFMNQMIRDLRRYGLARVDPNQRIQVHRLVQMVLREQMTEERAQQARRNVHNLLAAANPGEPDDPATWGLHAEINPHLRPAGLVTSESPAARHVILDGIRYLWNTGDYEGARRLGEIVVDQWRRGEGPELGPDGEQTLIVTRHLSQALRSLGHYGRARELTADTYDRFRRNPGYGPDHEHTIVTANQVGVSLRLASEYSRALRADEENLERATRVFGEEDPFTMRVKSNVAVSKRMLGDFTGAHAIDEQLVKEWRRTVGEDDPRTLFCVGNLARDLYGLGRYPEALELHARNWRTYREVLNPQHTYVLWGMRTNAIALRKAGRGTEALRQSEELHRLTISRFGPDHEDALSATMTLANALRAEGRIAEAKAFATDAVARYGRKFGERHGLTLAAVSNLAIILRALREEREARALDEATLEQMATLLGPEHPYTLCVSNNLANDLVLAHELEQAREISQRTYETSQRVRGDRHPYTLSCGVNLAFDLQATGADVAGDELFATMKAALAEALGPEHPETVDAGWGKRAECDIEPPPT